MRRDQSVLKKAGNNKQAEKPNSQPSRTTQKQATRTITVQNPIHPEESSWEIELLDIKEQEFLALWNSGSDRIGFSPRERVVYDRTRVVAKIVQEIKLKGSKAFEEEE